MGRGETEVGDGGDQVLWWKGPHGGREGGPPKVVEKVVSAAAAVNRRRRPPKNGWRKLGGKKIGKGVGSRPEKRVFFRPVKKETSLQFWCAVPISRRFCTFKEKNQNSNTLQTLFVFAGWWRKFPPHYCMGPTTTLIFPASCFPPPKLFGLLSFSFREKMETRRIFAHMSARKTKESRYTYHSCPAKGLLVITFALHRMRGWWIIKAHPAHSHIFLALFSHGRYASVEGIKSRKMYYGGKVRCVRGGTQKLGQSTAKLRKTLTWGEVQGKRENGENLFYTVFLCIKKPII